MLGVRDSQEVSIGNCGITGGVVAVPAGVGSGGTGSGFAGLLIVMVDGLIMEPSRYPYTPQRSAAILTRPFQVTQLEPLNFAASAKMGGALPPVLAMCKVE